MKQVPTDKYTIAWFKLAECVARGEKERALGVYRLLAHSFSDGAYRSQLEGDILFAFNDISLAVDKYKQAAQLYKQDGRLLQAVALYEHIIGIEPDNQTIMVLIELCSNLSLLDKAAEYQQKLIALLIENKDILTASSLLKQIDSNTKEIKNISLHIKLIMVLVKHTHAVPELITYHLRTVVDGLLAHNDQGSLQRFLSSLEAVDELLYVQAVEYIEMHKT